MYWGVRTPAELRVITRASVIAWRKDLDRVGSWRPDLFVGSPSFHQFKKVAPRDTEGPELFL
jgi:hypothetical protein